MASYLLLPGSDGHASCWSGVRRLLAEHGDVTSVFEGWSPGLAEQVDEVRALLASEPRTTLVTWSYSGLVGALVAAREPSLALVVHVDALLPGFATGPEDLARSVPPLVRALLGPDPSPAFELPEPRGEVVYVDCVARGAKPALVGVARSADLARACGWEVRPLAAGHRAPVTAPEALTDLLLELTERAQATPVPG